MRTFLASLALMLLAAACGPTPKPEGPIVNEGSAVSESCCCKSTPMTSVDGAPLYEPNANRMECSSKQGTCVDDVQCQGKAEDPGAVPAPPPQVTPESAPIQ